MGNIPVKSENDPNILKKKQQQRENERKLAESRRILSGNIVFPSDLNGNHAMKFTAINRVRDQKERKVKPTQLGHVILPVPNDLQVAYNAQYDNVDLGLIGELTKRYTADNIIDITNINDVFGLLGKAAKWKAATNYLKNVAIEKIMDSDKLGVKGILKGVGVARNPHKAMLFQGVDFRQHSFSYTFIAQNQQESENINQIINFFKFHMAPSYKDIDKHLFSYPDEFQISLLLPTEGGVVSSGSHNKYIHKFMPSVLTSFNVNYNGSGVPLFFNDTNAPVQYGISLSFTEMNIVTKEDIKAGK